MAEAAAPAASIDNFSALVSHNMAQPTGQPSAPAPTSKTNGQPAPANQPASSAPNDVAPGDAELEQAFEGDTQDPELEADSDEQAEQIQDLLEEAFHGKKGREILEAIKRGELPGELLTALKGIAKINGEDVPVSFAEALKGYQRLGDYTRSKQEIARERQEAREAMAAINDMISSWNNGESLFSGIKRLGKTKEFREAAIRYAQEEWTNEQLRRQNPEAFAARQEAREARERAEELEAKLRNAPNPQAERRTQDFAAKLQKLVFPAFDSSGIKDTPFARERFKENFSALYSGNEADLEQTVHDAVTATADQLSDLARKYQAEQNAQNGGKAKPNPAPLPGRSAAPATGAKTKVRQSLTPGDMDAFLREQREKRRY